MQLALVSGSGESAGKTVDVADAAFGAEFNQTLVHQVVTSYMAGARAGTKAQKTRAEVRGGGRKPWRQKGTGHARAGSIRSPLWRGGGATFAAKPRDYSKKLNRKMYRGALRAIVSELVRRDRLVVVEDISVERPKTKDLVSRLQALGLDDVLIIVRQEDPALELAARNLHWTAVVPGSQINPVSLLAFDKVLITVDALKELEERLA